MGLSPIAGAPLPPHADQPVPGGCPAIHLLIQEREAFRATVNEPVRAIYRILSIARKVGVKEEWPDAVDRIENICLWAMTSDPKFLSADDHAVLVPYEPASSGAAAVPVDPSPPSTR